MSDQIKTAALEWINENASLIADAHQRAGAGGSWSPGAGNRQVLGRHPRSQRLHGRTQVAGMPTAFVATYGSGGPTIGVMAELDALPGLSQEAVPYRQVRCEGGAGHGCGHCGYAASALGAALAVKAAISAHSLPGTIKCFGCPAEETMIGKVFMVRDGVFDGLDACLGHHPSSVNGVSMGSSSAMNSVKFEFFGKASHAAGSPEQGISALDAVELMNVGVNYMREHVIQETRMHYVIEEGGHEPNVVPAYARSWYYVRAPERDLVDRYYAWVLRIADGADLMAGTTHKVLFQSGAHNTIPNRPLAEMVVANMREIGAPAYSAEELAFATELGKSLDREEKLTSLRRSDLPEALDLIDVDLNTRIYDPFGEDRKGGGVHRRGRGLMEHAHRRVRHCLLHRGIAGPLVAEHGDLWNDHRTVDALRGKGDGSHCARPDDPARSFGSGPRGLGEAHGRSTYRSPLPSGLTPPSTSSEAREALSAPKVVSGTQPDLTTPGDSMTSTENKTLPTIPFGPHRLSRLILGANPINGGSHLSRFVNVQMKRYFTDEQIQALLRQCEKEGINAWQSSPGPNLEAYKTFRAAGGQMHYIALASESPTYPTMLQDLAAGGTIAIAHHGEVTDVFWRDGKIEQVVTIAAESGIPEPWSVFRRTSPMSSSTSCRKTGTSTSSCAVSTNATARGAAPGTPGPRADPAQGGLPGERSATMYRAIAVQTSPAWRSKSWQRAGSVTSRSWSKQHSSRPSAR